MWSQKEDYGNRKLSSLVEDKDHETTDSSFFIILAKLDELAI